MSFVHQESGDLNCGAYALAYWNWVRQDQLTKDQDEDANEVNTIYNIIQFGEDIGKLNEKSPLKLPREYSNPVKMMQWMKQTQPDNDIGFQLGTGTSNIITNLFGVMNELKMIPADLLSTIVQTDTLPECKYLILILARYDALHYVMVDCRKSDWIVYDPANGIGNLCGKDIYKAGAHIGAMLSTGTYIYC